MSTAVFWELHWGLYSKQVAALLPKLSVVRVRVRAQCTQLLLNSLLQYITTERAALLSPVALTLSNTWQKNTDTHIGCLGSQKIRQGLRAPPASKLQGASESFQQRALWVCTGWGEGRVLWRVEGGRWDGQRSAGWWWW